MEKLTLKVTRSVLKIKKWSLLLCGVICGAVAQGLYGQAWDHSLTLNGRSYPAGGSLDWESGYGISLWGSLPSGRKGNKSPWYGYIRPAFMLSTAGFYNYASAEVEVFPVSILGVSSGGSYASVTQDYSNYKCDTYHCQGNFTGQFVKGHLTLGVGSWFAYGQFKYERLTHDKSDQPFLLVDHAIRGEDGEDDLRRWIAVAGYQWSESWAFMVSHMDASMLVFAERSRWSMLNMRYRRGSWSVFLGLGVFESPLQTQELSALGRLRWEISPSVSIY